MITKITDQIIHCGRPKFTYSISWR